ncbi:MAG: hypothetical protein QXX99_04170 [Candidatus Bathyarchaeia archaeon]
MIEELRRKLVDLKQEISTIESEMERVASEIYELEERRRNLLLKMRDLKAESETYKRRLNVLKEEIKGLNETLSDLKMRKNEKIASLKELRGKVMEHLATKPRRRKEDLEAEIFNLDWKIQTSPLPLNDEKKIVAKIKMLEGQLHFYKELNSMRDEIQVIKGEIDEIRGNIGACVNRIAEKISEKRRVRERLAEIFKEIDEIRAEAERIDKEYKSKKERISELRSRRKDLLNQVTAIKRAIRDEEEHRRAEHISALKEKIKKGVLEKIERGEKVSFEELKIFFEEENINI